MHTDTFTQIPNNTSVPLYPPGRPEPAEFAQRMLGQNISITDRLDKIEWQLKMLLGVISEVAEYLKEQESRMNKNTYTCEECGTPRETKNEEGMLVIEGCKSCQEKKENEQKENDKESSCP